MIVNETNDSVKKNSDRKHINVSVPIFDKNGNEYCADNLKSTEQYNNLTMFNIKNMESNIERC